MAMEWRLCAATIHLAVQYFDIACHRRSFRSNELQLVALSALVVACKFSSRMEARSLQDFAQLANYTVQQVRHMELTLLELQTFVLHRLTPMDVVDHLLQLGKSSWPDRMALLVQVGDRDCKPFAKIQ